MKRNYLLSLLIILFSVSLCYAASEPEWINHPYKSCMNNEICASGDSKTLSGAKTDARNNILKYFETNVKSTFKSSLSSDEETVNQFTSEDLEELSSGILKGVKIKETFQNKDEYFAFAVLNKTVAGKELVNDINKLDSKMKLLLAEKNPKYNKQLEKCYQKREELNKKYLILTGGMIPEGVKYEDIFKNKKIIGSSLYYIEVKNNDLNDSTNYLKGVIVDNNFKITKDKTQANRFIILSVDKKNMYLNVEGFVKQKYSLTMKILDKSGKEIKVFTEDFVDTGRSENQIRDSINIQIKRYFDDNLEEILE